MRIASLSRCAWFCNRGSVARAAPTSIPGANTRPTILPPGNPILNGATITNTNTNTNLLNPANVVFNVLLTYKMRGNYGALKQLTFSINAQNIFNKHYYNYYSEYLPQGGQYGKLDEPVVASALVEPPASVMFDVSAKF